MLASEIDIEKLTDGKIVVWHFQLDDAIPFFDRLKSYLDSSEQDRANRYLREQERTRFVVARATLRELLGRYLGQPPETLSLGTNEYGKPLLEGANQQAGFFDFNVSHSQTQVAIGFANDSQSSIRIGIDVEFGDRIDPTDAFANVFLSDDEQARFAKLKANSQSDLRALQDFLLRHWVLKEAYSKALGQGTHIPLTEIQVPFLPDAKRLPLPVESIARASTVCRGWLSQLHDNGYLSVAYQSQRPNRFDVELKPLLFEPMTTR